jgi:hypothetical protein
MDRKAGKRIINNENPQPPLGKGKMQHRKPSAVLQAQAPQTSIRSFGLLLVTSGQPELKKILL